jgi:hypothetical protein
VHRFDELGIEITGQADAEPAPVPVEEPAAETPPVEEPPTVAESDAEVEEDNTPGAIGFMKEQDSFLKRLQELASIK